MSYLLEEKLDAEKIARADKHGYDKKIDHSTGANFDVFALPAKGKSGAGIGARVSEAKREVPKKVNSTIEGTKKTFEGAKKTLSKYTPKNYVRDAGYDAYNKAMRGYTEGTVKFDDIAKAQKKGRVVGGIKYGLGAAGTAAALTGATVGGIALAKHIKNKKKKEEEKSAFDVVDEFYNEKLAYDDARVNRAVKINKDGTYAMKKNPSTILNNAKSKAKDYIGKSGDNAMAKAVENYAANSPDIDLGEYLNKAKARGQMAAKAKLGLGAVGTAAALAGATAGGIALTKHIKNKKKKEEEKSAFEIVDEAYEEILG